MALTCRTIANLHLEPSIVPSNLPALLASGDSSFQCTCTSSEFLSFKNRSSIMKVHMRLIYINSRLQLGDRFVGWSSGDVEMAISRIYNFSSLHWILTTVVTHCSWNGSIHFFFLKNLGSTIDNALKLASDEHFKHCVKEHAPFLFSDGLNLIKDTLSIGILSILIGYLTDVQAFPASERLF
ncbi:uncharacterized protein LOC143848807 [Tasmannia lanceolata]|uniref:uncharacterized protein LOC143848807 n=1 Tax=Tasmannia lanceolata TaxID=3420 RepID=UPI0040636368